MKSHNKSAVTRVGNEGGDVFGIQDTVPIQSFCLPIVNTVNNSQKEHSEGLY